MKFSSFGRVALAMFASLALALGLTACGSQTVAYIWVLGQQYNQITGFKVDHFSGNLTQIVHSPFNSGGTNPVYLLVKPGGRYVYVLNQGGTPVTDAKGNIIQNGPGVGISLFSVGGDGVLTFQQTYYSQGLVPQWMEFDSTGGYLYVLDKYSPSGDGNGSISAFTSDPTTGRLFPVVNTQSVPPGQAAIAYFEVGPAPSRVKAAGSCLFTLNTGNNTVTPFQTSSGQLVTTTTGNISIPAGRVTSINGNGNYMILTDAANNMILPYTVGTGCTLVPLAGGNVPNFAGTSNPVNSLVTTSSNNTFVYVVNQANTASGTTQTYSTVSAWSIQNAQLTAIPTAPFSVGAGADCLVVDPTNEYIYTSDFDAGTVTGKIYDPTTGALRNLTRGQSFPASGKASCLALSPSVEE